MGGRVRKRVDRPGTRKEPTTESQGGDGRLSLQGDHRGGAKGPQGNTQGSRLEGVQALENRGSRPPIHSTCSRNQDGCGHRRNRK